MNADLPAFLRALAARPFYYGDLDCALTLADWWQANHGVDPAAELRERYFDEAICEQLVAARGGLLRLVGDLAAGVGAARAADPGPGDIGVVIWTRRYFGAIRGASGVWAIKAVDGLVLTRDVLLRRAWEI